MSHTPLPLPDLAPHLSGLNGICPLPHLGVIAAQGPEAAHFLHQQLTQDLLLLPAGQARLAAFCNAKGRMQASFVVLKLTADHVLLVLPQDLLERTLKRLSMFVLRAKVKLSDASAQWAVHGLLGASAAQFVQDAPWWHTVQHQGAHVVTLPPAQADDSAKNAVPRALHLSAADQPAPAGPLVAQPLWQWAEVLSAVPLLSAPLFELFVPQMLNYESVGGVNFKKGCYPGQEVVARSQFRGTLKRRMARVYSRDPLQVGQEVFSPADPEQPCAVVVQSAARPNAEGFDALVSGTLDSQSSGWHLTSATGPALPLLPLPYPLLQDI